MRPDTFGFDVLAYPRCRGLRLLALIDHRTAVDRILRHLGLEPPTAACLRGVLSHTRQDSRRGLERRRGRRRLTGAILSVSLPAGQRSHECSLV
jgi:hypothetical protein